LNGKSTCHKRIREGMPPAESIPGRVWYGSASASRFCESKSSRIRFPR